MGVFDLFKKPVIDDLIEQARERGAIILDVRTPAEYAQGHIPGAANLPLDSIGQAAHFVPAKNAVVYVYCQSGVRSSKACSRMKAAGFSNVVNAGGIRSYHGPVDIG